MPNSWRTDTFRSGMPGTPAWAWAGIGLRFRMFFLERGLISRRGMALGLQPVSNEPSLLEIVIGLDNFAQLILRARIPAIGIGVVTLHQLLEAALDLLPGGFRTKIEGFEGLQFQGLEPAPGLARRCRSALTAPHKKRMGVMRRPSSVARCSHAIAGAVCPSVGTRPPGRPVSDHALFLVGFDVAIAHAFEVIVGGIELAHVREA